MRPEDRTLLQKLRKYRPDLLEQLRREHFEEFQLKESTKWAAGIPSRFNESANVEKDEPKKICGTCKHFRESDYGTGSCGLDENPTTRDHEGCERWERAKSIGKSKESAGDVRSLVESVQERTKTLMSMC